MDGFINQNNDACFIARRNALSIYGKVERAKHHKHRRPSQATESCIYDSRHPQEPCLIAALHAPSESYRQRSTTSPPRPPPPQLRRPSSCFPSDQYTAHAFRNSTPRPGLASPCMWNLNWSHYGGEGNPPASASTREHE